LHQHVGHYLCFPFGRWQQEREIKRSRDQEIKRSRDQERVEERDQEIKRELKKEKTNADGVETTRGEIGANKNPGLLIGESVKHLCAFSGRNGAME